MPSSSRIHTSCAIAALVLFACGKTRSLGDGKDGDDGNDGKRANGQSTASGGQPQVPAFAEGGTFDEGAAQGGSPDELEPADDPPGPLQGLTGPDNLPRCGARAISRDGTTAGGFCQSSNVGGVVSIGALWNVDRPSAPTEIRSRSNVSAWVVNGDGSIAFAKNDATTFRWRDGEITDIPWLTEASASSADGSRVVGTCYSEDSDYFRACTWTEEEGTLLLPASASDDSSWAHAISADGSVIVGQFQAYTGRTQAVRWRDRQEPELLPIPTGAGISSADAISADGQVIGGTVWVDDVERPVRWTDEGLELLVNAKGRVAALNADGSQVLLDNRGSPYLLDQDGVFRSAYELAGVAPLNALGLGTVWAASDDLRVIVADFERGPGTNAYVLKMP